MGIPVASDNENVQNFIKEREIEREIGEELLKANGMRNFIVHRYNGVPNYSNIFNQT